MRMKPWEVRHQFKPGWVRSELNIPLLLWMEATCTVAERELEPLWF